MTTYHEFKSANVQGTLKDKSALETDDDAAALI